MPFIQFILILHADSSSPHELQKCSRFAICVLPIAVHPHAQALGVFGLTQTFSGLHEFVEHSRMPNFSVLPVLYSFSTISSPFLIFTHRNFWVSPCCSFPYGIVDVVAVFFPPGLICGSTLSIAHAQVGRP